MHLRVLAKNREPRGRLVAGDIDVPCALGPAGLVADKKEGDGGTPVARMALKTLYYRPDRMDPPVTFLGRAPILPDMGWCDEPASPAYNRLVKLPFDGSHERMWRDDHAYDLCVILGWNLDRPVPGRGSAIFFHLAKEDYSPTEGCIAVSQADMLTILRECGAGSTMETIVEGG